MLVPLASKFGGATSRRGGGGGEKSARGSSSGKSGSGGSSTSKGGSGGSGSTGKSGSSSPSSSKGGTGSSGTSSGGATSGKTTTVPLSTSTAGGKGSAVAYGYGGGRAIVIPAGQMFAGRSAGGGMRSQMYGSRTYGSGYPGILGRGVSGRGFPFWFWPIVWNGRSGVPYGGYLNAPEYGDPLNASRVGGPMAEATFGSNGGNTNTTFHVLSDNSTVASLIASIDANCSSLLSPSSSTTSPQAYDGSAPDAPQPEQAVQYYRASSIVLTLDGYNNSATLGSDGNATDSPLPSGIDMTLLDCLNQTIALSAPLVSAARGMRWMLGPTWASLMGLACWLWWIQLVL